MPSVPRQVRAAQLLLLMVIFQVPLFRTPCRSGVCETPLEVTVGQLAASKLIPPEATKALLYPGALLRYLRNSSAIAWDNLLATYNMDQFDARSAELNYRLEVMVGSYFLTFGAVWSMFATGRMPVIGLLLTSWGLYKEGIFKPLDDYSLAVAVKVYPTFLLALALAIMVLNLDGNKLKGLAGRGGAAPSGEPATPAGRQGRQQTSSRQKLKSR